MKATISLDNSVLEQLLTYTQTKTAKESIVKAIEEHIRYKQRQELLNCRGAVDIEDNWQALRDLEKPLASLAGSQALAWEQVQEAPASSTQALTNSGLVA